MVVGAVLGVGARVVEPTSSLLKFGSKFKFLGLFMLEHFYIICTLFWGVGWKMDFLKI